MRRVQFAALMLVAGCSAAPTNEAVEMETVEQPAPNGADANNAGKSWVTTQYLDRHSCPSDKCGIVGRLMFREAATVLERKGGWAKSSNDRDRPVYFMYCGGMTVSNRIYLNAATGSIYT